MDYIIAPFFVPLVTCMLRDSQLSPVDVIVNATSAVLHVIEYTFAIHR